MSAGKTRIAPLLASIADGTAQPVFLVSGDLVVADPAGRRVADALAARSGCDVETHRHPASLGAVLTDLRTFSLFATAKVILAVDTAIVTDHRAAADLIDQAETGLPVADPAAGIGGDNQRQAASRLLQALRVFGVDPAAGEPSAALDLLPPWAFQGGAAMRKRRPRGRPPKAQKVLREGLAGLLEAARAGDLIGFADGDLAELGSIVESGLPPGHALVLVESAVATDHPLVKRLAGAGAVADVGRVSVDRSGGWQGLQSLVEELRGETGVMIDAAALDMLAQRTLRQGGGWKDQSVTASSTGRFAAEYRKLASLVGQGGRIDRSAVETSIADRGDEDVWKILGALGDGRGGEALARYRRLMSAADDEIGARLSFFGLLASFCRQLSAIVGVMQVNRVTGGERNYQQFKQRLAPMLQGALPDGTASPLASLHPYRLHRAYLAGSRIGPSVAARLPGRLLETELRVKGDSSQADAAVAALMTHLAMTIAGRR